MSTLQLLLPLCITDILEIVISHGAFILSVLIATFSMQIPFDLIYYFLEKFLQKLH